MKEFWDFDENKNFKTIKHNGIPYKVLSIYHDYNNALKILVYLKLLIDNICLYLKINYYKYSKQDQIAIKCFLDIHMPGNNRCLLSEMQLNTEFNGLNKPRKLFKSSDKPLGTDKTDRAGYRHVFLTLRNSDGSFKSEDSIIRLTIHEITHSMCNHIRWRNDDHGKDFIYYENLLKDVYEHIMN